MRVVACIIIIIVAGTIVVCRTIDTRSSNVGANVRALLEHNWTVFREELDELPRTLITKKHSAPGSVHADMLELHLTSTGWMHAWDIRGASHSMWLNFALVFNGHPVGRNSEACPQTMALLSRIPGLTIAGFSWIKPHGVIEEHTDDNLGPMNRTWHVGLRVPPKCYLAVRTPSRVNTLPHSDGGVLMFDARNPHWAINFSDEDRFVLYLDITM